MRETGATGSPTTARSTTTSSCARSSGAERFRTTSDTEVILHAYRRWGADCVQHLRGMFAFALWDEERQQLFCARDRFGIKPFYYTVVGRRLLLRLEVKALLPFLDRDRDRPGRPQGLPDLPVLPRRQDALPGDPGAAARPYADGRATGASTTARYWEVYYRARLRPHGQVLRGAARGPAGGLGPRCTCAATCRSARYVSGGLDSSIVASPWPRASSRRVTWSASPGKFSAYGPAYDESRYARAVAERRAFPLHEIDITAERFRRQHPQGHLSPRLSRWPARARSRSTWSRGSRRSTARSCSAGRAATRSSAATPAT